jgi:hypothetical protein
MLEVLLLVLVLVPVPVLILLLVPVPVRRLMLDFIVPILIPTLLNISGWVYNKWVWQIVF